MPPVLNPLPLVVLVVLVVGLLVAEGRQSRPGIWATKPLAAGAYIWLAVSQGATASAYGLAVLCALGLCWLGDVLLIPRENRAVFRAGVLAFLAGHLAYAVAFIVRGVDPVSLVVGLVLILAPALVVRRWLGDRVPGELRGAVQAYLVVISLMFAMALGTHGSRDAWIIVAGAGLFWLSDLFVARDRFVRPGFPNRLAGLPLYFAAQGLLAISVAS